MNPSIRKLDNEIRLAGFRGYDGCDRTEGEITSGGPTSGYQLKLTDRGEGK